MLVFGKNPGNEKINALRCAGKRRFRNLVIAFADKTGMTELRTVNRCCYQGFVFMICKSIVQKLPGRNAEAEYEQQ